MSPSHTHDTSTFTGTRLLVTVILNFVIAAAEIVGGLVSGSLALLSDAIHSFSDGISLVITTSPSGCATDQARHSTRSGSNVRRCSLR